jgi:hypothetical protein
MLPSSSARIMSDMDKSNRTSVWAAIVAGSIAAVAAAYVITAGIDSLFGSPTEVMIGESVPDNLGAPLASGSAVVPLAPLRVLDLPADAQTPSAPGAATLPGVATPDAPTTADGQPGASGGDSGESTSDGDSDESTSGDDSNERNDDDGNDDDGGDDSNER